MLKGPSKLNERIPVEVGSIQVNFCKNPQCQNFGIPASTKRQPRGPGTAKSGRDTYTVTVARWIQAIMSKSTQSEDSLWLPVSDNLDSLFFEN